MIQSFSRMGKRPSADDISSIGKQQDDLIKSLAKFNMESRKHFGIDAFNECWGSIAIDYKTYEDSWDPTDPPELMHDEMQPECSAIALPLMLPIGSAHQVLLAQLLWQEFELHKGHANDALALICRIIGQGAFQYKKILRHVPDKVHCSQAWTSIQAVHQGLVFQSRIYMCMRKVIINLGLEPNIVSSIYQVLIKKDIEVSSAVADPNVAGSTWSQLSWIWTTHSGIEEIRPTNNHLMECMWLFCMFMTQLMHEKFIGFTGFGPRPHYTGGKRNLSLWKMRCIGSPTTLPSGSRNGLAGKW